MSLLSRLFGRGSAPKGPEPDLYQGYEITPCPAKDGGQYRVSAIIRKEVGGEMKEHKLVRADTMSDLDEATTVSLRKAKQLIDEQGEGLF